MLGSDTVGANPPFHFNSLTHTCYFELEIDSPPYGVVSANHDKILVAGRADHQTVAVADSTVYDDGSAPLSNNYRFDPVTFTRGASSIYEAYHFTIDDFNRMLNKAFETAAPTY